LRTINAQKLVLAKFKESLVILTNKEFAVFNVKIINMIKIKKAEDQDAKINEAVVKAKKRLI